MFQATAVISVIIDSAEAVDLPPRFESRHYSLAIAENAEPQRIGVVQAYHPFAGDSDPIVYSVLPGVDSALFTVNANSGVVSSLQPFDYEDKKLYQFQVSGCLLHNKTFCGFSNVTVTVSDENDNSPEFEQPSYSVDLPIDTPVGTEIVRLSASDKDSGNNADVSYALKTPSAIFSLDYQSGLLKTVVPFPEAKKFHLVVEAFDHGYPTRRQSADVFVNVHDNNPSAPEFDQFRYDVTKLAPVPAGSVLVTLHADDPDPGLEGQIVYRFAPTEDARAAVDLSKFTINPKTGQLSTKARLTSEDSNPLQFVVEAVDQSPTFPRKTQTVVRINILSDSVEQVAFLPLPKRVYISTSKVPGSVILKVSATRTSAPPVFSAKEHDEANYFEMVGDELRVKSKLVEGSVNVTLRVDAGSAFAEHILNVVIMAERDKYPVFPHLTYDVQVPVNATFPLLAQTFVAALAHGTVVYGTYPSDSLPVGLTLDAATGDLYASKEFVGAFYDKPTIFIVIRARNAEYPQFYSDVGVALSVSSSDRGFSFPVQLYRLMLRENSPPGTVLNTTVTVGNRAAYDGVKYELRPSELFSIDDDGVIRSRVSIDAEKLSRDSRGIIEMIVIAHNGKEKANATVQIKIEDVNEYVPKFDRLVYNVDVPENVEPGHLIVAVHAFDKDFSEGDRLTYKITKGDEQSLLLITQNGSIYKSDSGRFDHEMTKVFNVTVIGVDKDGNSAETTVQIHVSDVNDNEPKIEEPLVWNVTEGKKGVGSKFIISATDADADHNGLVSFNIIQGNKNHSFNLKSLPENRAELSVISELDREVAARHLLTIEARDHGSPPLFSVATVFVNVVDENDTPPYFIQDDYKQTVPMDLPVGFPLLTVRAEDDDLNSKLVYSIRSDPSNMFAINKDTGAISFSANVSDRIVGLYEVAVDVNDGIHSSTVIVSVDVYRPNGTVNSNATETTQSKLNRAPTFLSDSYEFSVNEGIVGPIGSVNFWDPDNDSVILSVEPKSYRNLFAVDQINGTLSVLKALSYSMERERYTFLVLATDTGRPPLTAFANVIVTVIDVNDHKPEFDRRDYSAIIPSAVSTPYTVPLGIIVRDGDSGENAQIRFTLKGADADCFSVDSSLGSLTFDCAIDYVHKTNYTLKMVATDLNGRGQSSEADLVIFIAPPTTLPVVPTSSLEISGNNADISSSVDEANEVCSVSFVRSTDEIMFQLDRPLDEPLYAVQTRCSCEEHCSTHYSISDPSLQPYFTVLPNGQLKLVKKLSVSALKSKHLLDKSGKLMIPIQLKTDEGSVSQLTLFVLPQESRQTDDVTSTTAASVSTLSYYNKLTGAGSYDGSASSESVQRAESMVVPVDVDITSGTTKKGALSWSGGDGIVTGVAPLPTALPSKESSNHPPTFPYELYKSLMPEGRYGSGALLSLKPSEIRAEDVDEGKEGFVTYHIESERPSIPFFIRNTTGELIIFGNIDREETTQYAFDVVATDQGDPPLSGRTRVEVKILDVNDNYPVFMEAPIVVPLLEDVPLGTVVATIHAEDADEGRFGEVRFSLLNYTDTFTIDSKSGVLRTAKQLSTGENDVYKLTIVASDLGKPALKSTFEVGVPLC
ncbi:unnamed protein product [Toxocara canis]|uniref:Protocadherin Fat 1 n=1 Tax=Toxocara canis TaxID=6265 RepID=A0A183TWE5_TOXCA|nr:unnamed protein product [Toxocara canis]